VYRYQLAYGDTMAQYSTLSKSFVNLFLTMLGAYVLAHLHQERGRGGREGGGASRTLE
jgi:hypothetical protein